MPVRRYRRRPPVVEAIQYTGTNADEITTWSGGRRINKGGRWVIATSPHMPTAAVGDYVVREPVPGGGYRYYGMPAEIFEHVYEPAPPTP